MPVTVGIFKCGYCDNMFEAKVNNIKTGGTRSCGCQRTNEHAKIHGLRAHRCYSIWNAMMQRCFKPKNKAYKDYGGRGITVCEEWLNPKNFLAWCDETYIEGHTLDRINNDVGYNPDNCRWVSMKIQAHNRRASKNNTSGYIGVYYNKRDNLIYTNITHNRKSIHIGTFKTFEEAALARNKYIIKNKLPHKLTNISPK